MKNLMPLATQLLVLPVLALPALAAAQAAPLMLYGQVTAGVTYKNHQSPTGSPREVGNGMLSPSLFGLRGSEDLGDGLSATFRLESAIASDTGVAGGTVGSTTKFWNRQSHVGLATKVASVTIGRQFHASTERVLANLDVYHGAGSSLHTTPIALFGVNRFVGNDSRVDDSIKLRLRGPAGTTAGISLGADDGAGRSSSFDLARSDANSALALYGVKYRSPNVIASTGQRPEHTVWGLGGNLQLGPVRAYLHYAMSQLDATSAGRGVQKNRLLVPALSAWVGSVTLLRAAYYHDRGRSLNGVAGRDGSKQTFVVSADYHLSKRSSLYATAFSNHFSDGYKLDPVNIAALGRDPSASGTSGTSVGVRHEF